MPEEGWTMEDGSLWPGNNRRDHDGIIQVSTGSLAMITMSRLAGSHALPAQLGVFHFIATWIRFSCWLLQRS